MDDAAAHAAVAPDAAKTLRVSLSCSSILPAGTPGVHPPLSVKRPAAPDSLTKSARPRFAGAPGGPGDGISGPPFYPCSSASSGAMRIR